MDRHNRKYNTNTGIENFILRLKENNPDLNYYSDYRDSENKVKLKCNKCGNVFERYASCVRQNRKIRCYECEKIETKKKKEQEKEQKKYKQYLIRKAKILLSSEQLEISICCECGKLFLGNKKYCSNFCRKKYHNTVHSAIRQRYKLINGNIDYTVTLKKLIKRDKNICYICHKECDLNDYTYHDNNFVAGNYYPSIDHIIPLSKGGGHSWDNVKLAHRICNSKKSDKIIF